MYGESQITALSVSKKGKALGDEAHGTLWNNAARYPLAIGFIEEL